MTNAPKFKLHVAPVKPGDFGPVGYCVWSDAGEVVIVNGDVVEAVGPVRSELDDEVRIGFRQVRTSYGFVGTVCWHDFNGRSGFEPL